MTALIVAISPINWIHLNGKSQKNNPTAPKMKSMKLLAELFVEQNLQENKISDLTDTLTVYYEELIENINTAKEAYTECQGGDLDAAYDAIADAWSEFYGCEYPLHAGDDQPH